MKIKGKKNRSKNKPNEETKIRKGFRKIHLGDDLWQYHLSVGIGVGTIVIYSPSNKMHQTSASEVMGMSWNEIEDMGESFSLCPSDIRNWIKKELCQ